MHAPEQRLDAAVVEPHPTAMIDRPGRILRWFYTSFFRPIAFPEALADRIRAAADRGTVIYVCRSLSYIDYLYFSFAFLAHELPLSRFANGVKTIFLQPLRKILRGALRLWQDRGTPHLAEFSTVVRRGDSALLFLRQPRTLLGWEPAGFRGDYFKELLRIQRERGPQQKPIVLVPLLLLWGGAAVRDQKSKRGLLDVVFGERESPGRLRSMWNFFRHYRDSQVLVPEPLDLEAFLREEADTGLPDEVLARRLRFKLGGRLESEMRVVCGPTRKGARRISEEVLRSRKLVAEAQVIAQAENIPWKQVERRARGALKEIAADPKPWMFEILRFFLRHLFSKIFDGIEIDRAGLERVREAARRGPLVMVPSHKSHVDYLVISYVFAECDLVPPHIAAGANLSFWPLGYFFRRAGAFFLRRTFRGDRLYAAVFRAYVRKLLRERHNVEFFIEGGRSRTGKLLAPKLGLLGMITEAALDDDGAHARRAQVCPISIGYEKVIEEKSYARELAGGEKRTEDMKGLLKATRVLWGQYGRLNIQFDEPFPLGATLREAGAMVAWDENENVVVPAEEAARRHATTRLAHQIVYGINRVTAVTPTALAGAALLASGRRGILRRELLEYAQFLVAYARHSGGRLSAAVYDEASGGLIVEALDRALDLLAHDGDLEVRRGTGSVDTSARLGLRPLDEIYTVPDDRRARLAYYRNNAIHLYVADGLIALGLGGMARDRSEVEARTLGLSRLLKLEFSYRVGATFETIFAERLAAMRSAELLTVEGSVVTPRAAERLSLLSGQVEDFVESYLVAARALETLVAPIAEKDLIRRIHELGEKLFFTGVVRRREACVRANYQNAVALFKERRLIVEEERKLRVVSGAEVARQAAEIVSMLPPH